MKLRLAAPLLAILATGCHMAAMVVGFSLDPAYRAGALSRQPGLIGIRHLGCLEIAAARTVDAAVPAADPVIRVAFGNGCDAPVPLDLRRLRVTARYGDGAAPIELALYDPSNEVRATEVEPRAFGRELLAFVPPPGRAGAAPDEVCVDLGHTNSAFPPQPEGWMCSALIDARAVRP